MKKATTLTWCFFGLFIFITSALFSQETCGSVTNSTPTATLDNDIEVTATVDISDNLFLTSMSLDISIIHTYIGDVKFNLVSPSGTRIIVCQGICGDKQNMEATFTDEGDPVMCAETIPAASGLILPFSAFSNFADEPIAGTWTLEVTDTGPGDTGIITSWTLNYCGVESLSVPENTLLSRLTLSPNPAKNFVDIALPNNVQDPVFVQVFDVLGKQVTQTNITNSKRLDISSFTSGIYMVQFTYGNSQSTQKLVIQ